MKRNDTRALTVKGQPWEYKIGRNTVAIYDPEGNRFFPKFYEVGQKTNNRYDPNRDEYVSNYLLNPAIIVNYIETKILGIEVPSNKKCIHCQMVKADVYLNVNPFAAEIHEDYTKHYLCNACCNELAGEI